MGSNFAVQLSECSYPVETGHVVVEVVLEEEDLAEDCALACTCLEAVLLYLASVLAMKAEEERIRALVQDCEEEDRMVGSSSVPWELSHKPAGNRSFDVSVQGRALTYHAGHSPHWTGIQARPQSVLLQKIAFEATVAVVVVVPLVYGPSCRGNSFSRIDSNLVGRSDSVAHVADQLCVQKLLAPSPSCADETELMHQRCVSVFRPPISKLVEDRSPLGLP